MFGRFWVAFRVVGLAAFREGSPFRYSVWSLVSGYALASAALAYALYLVATGQDAEVFKLVRISETSQAVLHIEKITLILASCICLVMATCKTKSIFRIAFEFEQSQRFLPSPHRRWKYAVFLSALKIALMTLEIMITPTAGLDLLPWFYLRILLFMSEVLFTTTVLTLNDLFLRINAKLKHSIGGKMGNLQLPFIDHTKGSSTHRPAPTMTSLRILSSAHWKLCTVGTNINDAFNGQLLAIFIYIVVRIITRPYFVFLNIVNPKVTVNASDLIMNVGWVVAYWLELCLLLWSCSLATREAGETSTIIVHNLNKPLPENERQQMELFLVQLSNHKLVFTVFNLFTIDLPALTSIAEAVTTYLVILIQFQTSR